MKYSVSDLRLMRQMVLSANAKDWEFFSSLLHKRQPHFAGIIDEVGEDPRCYESHRFCTLFCAVVLEQAERISLGHLPIYSEVEFQDVAGLIARGEERRIGKRAVRFPDRIRRHVLSRSNFDETDTQWLCTTISAFLVIVEKSQFSYEQTSMSY